MAGPLSGVRVIDLTSVVSGPFATMFLADQGADVIKVEPLGGDITRRSRQSIDPTGQFSALFISTNRGKRSISLDIKQPKGAEILRKLIARSDVLVQNFRPQVMERLGLGEAALRELNPRLIYVSISGAGDSGPYAEKRIYDPIIQGLSGFADVQAEAKTRRPQMIRTIVADKTTSVVTAQAVAAALYAREKTGVGVVTELMDTENADAVEQAADVIQIGTRNMQNFSLLRRVSRTSKPVLLKRGMSATLEEWLTERRTASGGTTRPTVGPVMSGTTVCTTVSG